MSFGKTSKTENLFLFENLWDFVIQPISNFFVSAGPRDFSGGVRCLCDSCVGVVSQPTFSVGVGGGPGEFDLRSAMREQPFEDTETYRGFQSFRELRHIGADEVDVNFLLRKLRDEAKTAWDDVYSNRLVSRNTVLVCLKTYFEFYFFF